jgi:hypothetical protein
MGGRGAPSHQSHVFYRNEIRVLPQSHFLLMANPKVSKNLAHSDDTSAPPAFISFNSKTLTTTTTTKVEWRVSCQRGRPIKLFLCAFNLSVKGRKKYKVKHNKTKGDIKSMTNGTYHQDCFIICVHSYLICEACSLSIVRNAINCTRPNQISI